MSFNVIEYLYYSSNNFSQSIFYRDHPIEITYGEFLSKVVYFSDYFSEVIEKVVAIDIERKDINMYSVFSAMWKNKNTIVPLISDWDDEYKERIINAVKADIRLNQDLSVYHIKHKVDRNDSVIIPAKTAYILFTSGSTGLPKGVPITHLALKHYIDNIYEELEIEKGIERLTNTFSPAFDLFYHDLFLSWKSASSITPVETKKIGQLLNKVENNKLTYWFSVPTLAQMLISLKPKSHQLSSLKVSLFCGELLRKHVVTSWAQISNCQKIFNLYGPTETTIACMISDVGIEGPPSLGRALGDMSYKTEHLSGNLYKLLLSGPQIFNGYIGTSKNSFVKIDGKVYYDTGDLVTILDGEVYFEGRIDRQTKIMGHRVDLQGLEEQLRVKNNNPLVFVVLYYDKNIDCNTGITIFYQPKNEGEIFDCGFIKNVKVKGIFCIESVPTLISGKVNYKKLELWAKNQI
ncbi:AMP-binding protein [Photorhabdus laumondii subsp. laumondii]|uniref:Photorhabdus luminescens subsp. laumondii TTO1 complete genome segment 9/17 n=2 Tax=Photorhabdus laumondii subsp. laumondii TaxID=141679 RepID=Q7N4D3_PHOLL|nr:MULTISPECIES: AMP-binding protein [Photorhabdus]AWK42166.1 hypothetical protein A4R40_12010 [Photorhabdus laumondii subsp. laumondii]AXG43027.1 hypothetical protein PluDJC_12725 [Photorhabdus laumondii subsp. laumondii]AXG47486.1 hypothetical protein PluTT01m_12385 [Photorhabdus laumondii subsp. laumondii]MCC8386139.1 AMP-binding protein [Photorhabdus laumondii]MCC8390772.1 AMP-binding protein [Photorhabdus laumondii]